MVGVRRRCSLAGWRDAGWRAAGGMWRERSAMTDRLDRRAEFIERDRVVRHIGGLRLRNLENARVRRRTYMIAIIVVGTAVAVLAATAYRRVTVAVRAIEDRHEAFCESLQQERFGDAYAIMSPDYRKAHDLAAFRDDYGLMNISRLSPGHSVRVGWKAAWLFPDATPEHLLEPWAGKDYEWVKVDGQWYMTGNCMTYLD